MKVDITNLKLLKKLIIEPGKSIKQKAVRSIFWVFIIRIFDLIFNFTRIIILAKLLSPKDFGVMGIALLTISTLETFTQTGFRTALIQKKENVNTYINTAWTFEILKAIFLFFIIYWVSPFVANFFNSAYTESIIKVIGVSILFRAFTNIYVIYFQKELEFNKQFIYQLTGTLSDFIVSIIMVFLLKNVWALVSGWVARNFFMCVISYIIHPLKPSFELNFRKIKNLWNYGRWVLTSNILTFIITQGDDILVGKLLGPISLGLYRVAYRVSNMPATEISHIISKVSFPTYSKLQTNLSYLKSAYLKILKITSFLSFFITGLIFVLAPDFVNIFWGQKWSSVIPVIQIMVIAGLIRSLAVISGSLFYGIGKPHIDTRWQLVRLFIMSIFIFPLTLKWGIIGTSIAVLISIFVSNLGFSITGLYITKCKVKEFIEPIVVPFINSIIMILFIVGVKKTIYEVNYFHFGGLILIGTLMYFLITYIDYKHFYDEINRLIQESLRSFVDKKE